MAHEYSEPFDLPVDEFTIFDRSVRYRGWAVLRWDPAAGAHLVGRVEASNLPTTRSYLLRELTPHAWARLRFANGDRGAICVPLNRGVWEIASTIDAAASELFFRRSLLSRCPLRGSVTFRSWTGFGTDTPAETRISINGRPRGGESAARGLEFRTEDGLELSGSQREDGRWTVSVSDRAARRALTVGVLSSLPMAFALRTACSAPILEQTLVWGGSERQRLVAGDTPRYGQIHLFPDDRRATSEEIGRLAVFLAGPTVAAMVFREFGRRLFVRRTPGERRLFLGTSVEAILRTLSVEGLRRDPRAAERRARQFEVENGIRAFCAERIPSLTTSDVELVRAAFSDLRHREAHPNWLFVEHPTAEPDHENQWRQERMLAAFLGQLLAAYCPGLRPISIADA